MDQEQMNKLSLGDVVVSKATGLSCVVTGNYGGRVTAVRSVDITNPIEWDVVMKHNTHRRVESKISTITCDNEHYSV